MVSNTKFNLGDEVWIISKYIKVIKKKCPVCEGTQTILYKGELYPCPSSKCSHGYINELEGMKWHVSCNSVIGQINTTYRVGMLTTTTYMVEATGIGSGTCWDENDLFHSKKEAEERCDELNKEH